MKAQKCAIKAEPTASMTSTRSRSLVARGRNSALDFPQNRRRSASSRFSLEFNGALIVEEGFSTGIIPAVAASAHADLETIAAGKLAPIVA